MRSDTRARLDSALRKQQLKLVGIGAGVAAVMGALLWYTSLDATIKNRPAPGTISAIDAAAGQSTQIVENEVFVTVKLDDGRAARVLVLKTSKPALGQKVEIAEHIHGSGRSTFSWK